MSNKDLEEQFHQIDTMNDKLWYQRGMYEPGFDPMKEGQAVYERALELGYEKGIARSTINLGLGMFIIGHNVSGALDRINEAQELFKKENNKKWLSNCLSTIAIIENTSGNKKDALYNALKSVSYYEEGGEVSVDAVMAYYVAGTVYKDLDKLKEAEKYFLLGISLDVDPTNTWAGRIYAGLTSVYTQQEKYEEAIDCAFKGLHILKSGGNSIAESRVLTEIGLLYKKQKRYKEAFNYFYEGLKLRDQVNMEQFMMSSLTEIADLYQETGEKEKALEYLMKAELIAVSIKRPARLAAICKDIAEIYKSLNEHKQALAYYEKFMTISTELNKQETEKKIHELQHGVLKEKEEEIERLKNVELKHAYEIISERNKEVTDSINYARRIQNSVLPTEQLLHEYLNEHFLLFKPKDIVSGDFYWSTHKVDGEKEYFYLAVADSTGHGVPGAFMSLLNITFLNEAVNEKDIHEPHHILNHVRNRLIDSISRDGGQDGMDCILMCIDLQTKSITYASANNAPVVISNGTIHQLKADKMPVGKGERSDSFVLHKIDAQKNDLLYLYTDGYADQFGGAKGKKFKYKQLDELLVSISALPTSEQKEILDKRFEEWRGKLEQVDDVCIIGIRF